MWTVETLNAIVDAEIGALPADMQARLIRLGNVIEAVGFEGLPADATSIWKRSCGNCGFAEETASLAPST